MHESAQYHVDKLDWDERKAYVRRVDVDHYTYADRAVTLKPLETFASAPATGGDRAHGEVMVSSLVSMFKKLKFGTDENLGWGPVHLPEIELQTTAYWLMLGSAADGWRRADLDVALLGVGPGDAGRRGGPADGRPARPRPGQPGPLAAQPVAHGLPLRGGARAASACRSGSSTATTSWSPGAADLIAGCGCESGCPACTGPRLEPDVDAKALALRLLRGARARAARSRGRAPAARDAGGGGMTVDGARLARRLDDLRRDRRLRAPTAPPATRTRRSAGPSPRSWPPANRSARRSRSGRTPAPVDPRRRWRSAWPQALDGDAVETPHGWYVRRELRPGLSAARSGAAGRPAGDAGRRHSPALPRHGDDRPRQRRRDGRLPDRPRLVAGRPAAARPARPAGPLRGGRAARRAGRDRSAGRLPGHLQRPDLRLAAAGDALPDGPAGRHRRSPATWTCSCSCGGCSATACPTRASRPWNGTCSAATAPRTSRPGRSRPSTTRSCAAGRPARSASSPATTPRTWSRSAGSWPTWSAATARARSRRWAPPGDLVRLARLFRHEAASTKRSRAWRWPARRSAPAIRTWPWPPWSWLGCSAAGPPRRGGRGLEPPRRRRPGRWPRSAGSSWPRSASIASATWPARGPPRTRPCWLCTAAAATARRSLRRSLEADLSRRRARLARRLEQPGRL